MTSTYIKNLEKKQAAVLKEQNELLAQEAALEKKLNTIRKKKGKVFMEYHNLRQQIEIEQENGFPHGRK